MPRIFCDVDEKTESDFKFLKGAHGCKTNGQALEAIVKSAVKQERKAIALEQAAADNE